MNTQHWSNEEPCRYCGATSNTTHFPSCRNAGLYDAHGNAIPSSPATEPALPEDPLLKARAVVTNYFNGRVDKTDNAVLSFDKVYVVWFCYILGGWKVLLSTTIPDGVYYEVTYNSVKKETYLDVYKKFENVKYPDFLNGE